VEKIDGLKRWGEKGWGLKVTMCFFGHESKKETYRQKDA